ncbi:MAG: hypothetical protein MnENMB40S_24470 [Rhizobiaceae bacterium MnEN-MB40S]|nr:MAG: hypothetical protein MnENMB40S_24470 [Rhizobiaceae bacterium MnEN-MB40S]
MKYDYWNEYYVEASRGDLPSVFVIPHPFVDIGAMSLPNYFDHCIEWEDIPEQHPFRVQFTKDQWDFDIYAKQQGTPVAWKEVADRCGFRSIAETYHAVLSQAITLKNELRLPELAKKLYSIVQRDGLLMPEPDAFPAILEKPLGELFEALGKDQIIIESQTQQETREARTADLKAPDRTVWQVGGPTPNYLYPKDMSVVVVSLWESHHSMICLNEANAGRVNPSRWFEGFWATKHTGPDWWQEQPWQDIVRDNRNQALL